MSSGPETPSFRLDGRVAIVTGASSGIGRQFARTLSGAGALVVLAARRTEMLESLASELTSAMIVTTDVAREEDLTRLVEATMDRWGRIDVLVNNAGAIAVGPAEDETAETFRHVIEVNLVANFLLTQLVARHMLDAGSGSIVSVASILGLVGSGRIPLASYAASKGAIVNLARELAAQWANRGVRVNVIAPGWFETEMTGEMFSRESGRRYVEQRTPAGRLGELSDLDGALLFLASDASAFVTGQTITVDGGWTSI